MAKLVDGELYLSPLEASSILKVSYKTLQRWAESGILTAWVGTNGSRRREQRPVQIEFLQTPTGFRLYRQSSIERLRDQLKNTEAA